MKKLFILVLVALMLTGAALADDHSSAADFVYNSPAGIPVNVAEFFQVYGLDVKSMITSRGGDVTVSDKPSSMPAPGGEYVLGLAIHNTSDIVGKTIFEQMQKACDEIGVKYELNDAAADQNIQNAAIEQWVAAKKIDGAIVYPRNYSAVGPALNELAAAGIPTLVGITPLQGTADALTLIPNEEMGKAAAEYIIEGLLAAGKELKGQVVYGTLNIVHSNVPGREYGFFGVMEQYPDIELVKIDGAAVDDFYSQMESLLVKDRDMEIIGAWGLYSGAMLGMSQAIVSNDRSDINMVGIDYDQKVMADIKEGLITATIGHNPVIVGYWNVCNMVNMLNGVEIPAVTRVPYDIITKDNVDDMYQSYFPGTGTLDEYIGAAAQ
ncbi:MAG: sugar ABC transporter substrate-binding protein [Clostridia bacterium]|nr:sugar ABC transporter substrate-binding protein [Clostridia bacterium]